MEKYFIVSSESKLGTDYLKYQENVKIVREICEYFLIKHGIKSREIALEINTFGIVPTKNDIEKFSYQCKKKKEYAGCNDILFFKANSVIAKDWATLLRKQNIKSLNEPNIQFYTDTICWRGFSRLLIWESVVYGYFNSDNEDVKIPEGCTEIKGSEYYNILEQMKCKNE